MQYAHLTILAIDNKSVSVYIRVIQYTLDESKYSCVICKNPRPVKLWQDNENIKCFDCIPWGNSNISKNFKRVGRII